MATYTSYLNLEKPTTSETFNLLKMNQNWDKIDQGVSALNSKITNVAPYQYINIESGASATVSRTKNICLIYGIQRGSTNALMDIYSTLNDAVRHVGASSVLSYTFTSTTLTITNAASQNVHIVIIA